jgi:poly-gamma-glutamate capsule biosynthesis protein CapA/YwtB (metallophosphatase superfamily)/outer membrane protein assembly factor BamB
MLAAQLARRTLVAGWRLRAALLLAAGLVLVPSGCSPPLVTTVAGSAVPALSPGAVQPHADPLPATPSPTAVEALPASTSPTSIPEPTLGETPTPSPTATSTPYPSPTPGPCLEPEPPQLVSASAGEPLSFSVRLLTNVDGHLTAGAAADFGGQSVFVISSLDRMVQAYAAGGRRLWKARTAGPAYALAVLEGGLVAYGDDAGEIVLLDSSGRRLWRHDLCTRVTALSSSWQQGLLAGGWDERLTLLNIGAEDVRVRWQAQLDGRVSGIAVLPGLAVVSTGEGTIRAYDPSGTKVWQSDAGSPVTGLASEVLLGGGKDRKVILAGVQDGRLMVVDANGKLLWQVRLGDGGPVFDVIRLSSQEAPVIVAATGGKAPTLSMLSTEGEWQWRRALPAPAGAVTALDVDSDGQAEILAGLADGEVVAYDRHGRQRASVQAGLPVSGVLPAGGGLASGGMVLAHVNAWRLVSGGGTAAVPRLSAPQELPASSTTFPSSAVAASGGQSPRAGAVLVFLGDVVPGRSMEAQIDRYGPGYPWAGLAYLLLDADLAMANLECVLSTQGRALTKPYVIRAHPDMVRTLTGGKFDLVTLANNHTLDYGTTALGDTLSALEGVNITAVGAGRTAEDARRPALFDLKGVRVAVLAYAGAYWQGSADVPDTDLIAWASPEAVASDVSAVRSQADVVVVVLHAGKEYARTPSATQVSVARVAIEAGADLVVGHHPHVTQTVERYGKGLIVYSLGNALFDIPLQAAMLGELLRVQVTQAGLIQAELWPFWIDDEIQPRLLDDGQGVPRFRVIYP